MKATGEGFNMSPECFSVMPMENGVHSVYGEDWNLQWYEFDGHIICTAGKSRERTEIEVLGIEELGL